MPRGLFPALDTVFSWTFPSRFSRNAIDFPSGDQTGRDLSHLFLTSHRTRRVPMSRTPISKESWRFDTKASSRPSGDHGLGAPDSPPIELSESGKSTTFFVRPARSTSPT